MILISTEKNTDAMGCFRKFFFRKRSSQPQIANHKNQPEACYPYSRNERCHTPGLPNLTHSFLCENHENLRKVLTQVYFICSHPFLGLGLGTLGTIWYCARKIPHQSLKDCSTVIRIRASVVLIES